MDTPLYMCQLLPFLVFVPQRFQILKQQNVSSFLKYDKWQVDIKRYFVYNDGPMNLRPPRL